MIAPRPSRRFSLPFIICPRLSAVVRHLISTMALLGQCCVAAVGYLATRFRLAGCPLKLGHLPTELDRFDLLFLQRANIVTNTAKDLSERTKWTIREGNDTMTLSSRTALVTGGGSGI